MKAGDTIQVQQLDQGAQWIYATVITANADGSALVQIQHPCNRDDAKMLFFGKDKIRTKADLVNLSAAAVGRAAKTSFDVQADRLS
jgi:hypothetical protein